MEGHVSAELGWMEVSVGGLGQARGDVVHQSRAVLNLPEYY